MDLFVYTLLKKVTKALYMPKSRLQKAEMLARYEQLIAESKMAVIFAHDGLNVTQSEGLRATLFEHGEKLAVVQNTLLQLAMAHRDLTLPDDVWGQPLAMAISDTDEVTVSKDLADFIKSNENARVVAGIYEGKIVPASVITELANLPSREQLLGQVVGTLAAPLSGFVTVLSGTMRGLVTALKQIEEKKAS